MRSKADVREPTTKKCEKERLKSKKNMDMLRTIGRVRGIRGVSHEAENEGYDGKDLRKRKGLSLE